MSGRYDPLYDVALLLAAVTQTGGCQARVARDPLVRLGDRLGFTHRSDPSEIEDALRGTVERHVRRDAAREVLALDAEDHRLAREGARNVGPYGDMQTSLRRLARGEPLPRPEELRGGGRGE